MAGNWVQNIVKGRAVELWNRVDSNDPAISVIVLIPLKVTTTEAEAKDYANLKTFLEGTADEQTEGWSRKILTDTETGAISADMANDRFPISVPAVTWTAPTAAKNTAGLAICYDPKAGEGTDEEILVMTVHDFVVTADGNDVILSAGEFFRAT